MIMKKENLPSKQRKHVKNKKKVCKALEELQNKHNHSWFEEIMCRNHKNMDKQAIFYRGNEISYKDMEQLSFKYAKSLKKMGISKGDKVIACMSNMPELIYLMLAANQIGAVINFISADFEPEFLKQICYEDKQDVLFVSDNYYKALISHIDISRFKYCIVLSLTDSLPEGKDPYKKYDNEFYEFKNYARDIKENTPGILLQEEFLRFGSGVDNSLLEDEIGLDTEFTITYTSGSTKIGWPKAIVHTNRSYISIGRFHDSDLSRMPAMREMRGLAHIPTHSNTDLVSSISDTLMQRCTVACEPIYDEMFFGRSLVINKPNFAPATRSFWVRAMKLFFEDPILTQEKLPFLVNAVSVGEDISKNEEEFINECFKKLDAGKDRLPSILRPTTISVGGGDCEHGGLFFTLLKGTREKLIKKDYGLIPFQLTELAILREDGTECKYGEMGILVANSPCTMKEYYKNPKATKNFFVRDTYGRIWGNCNVWAYLDKSGRIHMRGRVGSEIELETGCKLPMYLITDIVLESKCVLSCETVTDGKKIVSYIEKYPGRAVDENILIDTIRQKIIKRYGMKVNNKFSVQFVSNKKSFILTKSGKRNLAYLEGLI